MERRRFLKYGAMAGVAAVGGTGVASPQEEQEEDQMKLQPPKEGKIPVAFLLSAGATMIDFAGPWEVFQDVHVRERGSSMDRQMPFRLYTVSESSDSFRVSGGMQIIPDFTLAEAPPPKVVVIPAQGNAGSESQEWLRDVYRTADVLMSVCTGAFVLARAGLLDGLKATTHHDFYDLLQKRFPKINVQRGLRYVEGPRISTAGGLTSGIDLALRVVERYFGRAVVEQTVAYMEYQGEGWKDTIYSEDGGIG